VISTGRVACSVAVSELVMAQQRRLLGEGRRTLVAAVARPPRRPSIAGGLVAGAPVHTQLIVGQEPALALVTRVRPEINKYASSLSVPDEQTLASAVSNNKQQTVRCEDASQLEKDSHLLKMT